MIRSATRLAAAMTLSLAAGAWLTADPASQNRSTSQSGQTAQQVPTFRSAANLVTVDAYPRKDGHILEGLTPRDFDVFEDGKPQAIDQFEFVRVEPAPEVPRVDPNNQRDMLQQVADPHNRVFVVYLDIYHVSLEGSHDIRRPLVEMLNRIIAPNDLFAVTTSKVNPKSIVLARRMESIEQQLADHWPWGERKRTTNDPDDPAEDYLNRCGGGDELRDRRREDITLDNLTQLIDYVGSMREARTSVIAITDGWRLFRPDELMRSKLMPKTAPGPAPVGTGPDGRLITLPGMTPYAYPGEQACAAELARLAMINDDQKFRDLIGIANRKNVVFYPVNPSGLEMFDSNLIAPGGGTRGSADAARPEGNATRPGEIRIEMMEDMDRHKARVDSALTLAHNTDGIAVVNTNDLREGLAKIVNDVSAYYLLGYYSTNPKADGTYRQIKVRVKQDKVDVVARRGYVAASSAAEAPRKLGTTEIVAPAEVRESMGPLSRIGSSDLFTYGIVSGKDLAVVTEVASDQIELGKWRTGGTVTVMVTGAAGDHVGSATGKIEPGARAVLLRVPYGNSTGPWKVGVTLTGSDGSLDDRLDVRAVSQRLLADPILYRSTGVARIAPLRPVADFLYHRTERVHIEWPVLKPLDGRTARLLDPRGQPLPAAATLTERDDSGQSILAADLTLAQLSPGDYVLEVSATSGAESQKRQVALRVVR